MRTIETTGHAVSVPIASVRPDLRDWHVAHVPLVDLSDLHWDDGGLCAFTSCDAVVAGELPHPSLAHDHPHAVRVCILREDNDRGVFDRLRLEAGPPPRRLRDAIRARTRQG